MSLFGKSSTVLWHGLRQLTLSEARMTHSSNNSFTVGQPSITGGAGNDNDLAPNQIAAITFPSSVFAGLEGPLAISVTVYEEPSFFPLPENDTGLQTMVGTPVVSLMVARDRNQLQFQNLDPPVELTLAITQLYPMVTSTNHLSYAQYYDYDRFLA